MFSSRTIACVIVVACAAMLASRFALSQTMPATSPGLLPVPDALAQDHARLMIYTLFKDDFAKSSVTDRQALAKRLLSEAEGTKDDSVARYVLLTEAIDFASVAGDPETAFKAAVELGRLYQVDAIDLQKQALFRTNYAASTADASEVISRLALDTADKAALADAFETVSQLTNLAEGAADKTHKVSFVASIQVRLGELRSLVRDYPKVQKSLAVLQRDPENADAHLAAGSFYALRKGQWSVGLPHLAACGDETLRALAQQDLANPSDGLKQALLGDAWWAYGENARGAIRTNVQQHACEWYRRAEPDLAGITLTRIQSRMEAITAGGHAAALENVLGSIDDVAVDLLPLIDPSKDATDGKWAVANHVLQCESGRYACIRIPYSVPEEYDLRITFARTEGQGPLTVLLTSHNKSFGLALDVKGEARFERVGGKIGKDNPTTAPVAISNNHKYLLTIGIHKDGVKASLDNKLITEWKTDYKDLSRYAVWKLPDARMCALGANNAQMAFYSVEIVELAGKGKPTR